jgi:hypothetical protein
MKSELSLQRSCWVRIVFLAAWSVTWVGCSMAGAEEKKPPTILIISIDDLNDWIGCLGGHPQALTPNIDRLAARGVLFSNAHCQSPVCNPSRASLMTSLYPETSGIYFLNPDLEQSPVSKKVTLLPHRFQQEGYHVTGAGKLFHSRQNEKYLPNYAGSFGEWARSRKRNWPPFPVTGSGIGGSTRNGMRTCRTIKLPPGDRSPGKRLSFSPLPGARILPAPCPPIGSPGMVRCLSAGGSSIAGGA